MADTEMQPDARSDEGDIFRRPSEFRLSTVLEVWDRAERGPKKDTRIDWRNGTVVGPWTPGENRDGIWDVGHKEAWYKVAERLKRNNARRNPENKMTREEVIDEFNDIDNLGVEDPVLNRKLGVNSHDGYEKETRNGKPVTDEDILFEGLEEDEKEVKRERYRAQVNQRSQVLDSRLGDFNAGDFDAKVSNMAAKKETKKEAKQDEVQEIDLPKRVIVWDTETTGLHPQPKGSRQKHRIVEVAAVEMIDGKPTGKVFHEYLNPERHVPRGASDVHGLDDEFLKDKPTFSKVSDEFLKFIGDAPLVAHNASFDMRFINAELEWDGKEPIGIERKVDTLRIARKVLPDLERHDLDTLAEHFKVDTSGRDDFHGGLVDTMILAEVTAKLFDLAKEQGVSLYSDASLKAAEAASAGDYISGLQADLGGSGSVDRVAEVERELQQAKMERHGHAPRKRGEDAAISKPPASFVERLQAETPSTRTLG